MNIISNIYTRMNSMDFYKMKKNIQYRDFLQYLQLILWKIQPLELKLRDT